MNKTALLCTLLTFFATQFTHTDSAHKKSGTTVVVVKGGDVVQKSEIGKKIQKKLEEEQRKLAKPLEENEQKIKDKERKLIEEKKSLDKEVEDIQKNSLLSIDAKKRKMEDLEDKARRLTEDKAELDMLVKRLQADAQRLNEKMSHMYQEEMGKFDGRIKKVIKEVAKQEGWDIVLMEESIVFASDDNVKTDLIIKELDKDEA